MIVLLAMTIVKNRIKFLREMYISRKKHLVLYSL